MTELHRVEDNIKGDLNDSYVILWSYIAVLTFRFHRSGREWAFLDQPREWRDSEARNELVQRGFVMKYVILSVRFSN